MNYVLTLLVGVIALVGNFLPSKQIWDKPSNIFGAISFPASLDTLTNPASTDSVATVSHSSQHSNANDAIEALEAKLGIKASTPVTNTILVGDGTGSSIWSTYATTTSIYATNLLSTGSSTLTNFTFSTATGTSATTTNFFSTTASSTNLYGNNINGFDLSSCTGTNYLQWTGGKFVCTNASTLSDVTVFSTTTTANMATTTLKTSDGSLPVATNFSINIAIASTTGANNTTANTVLILNNDRGTNYSYGKNENATPAVVNNTSGVPLYEDDASRATQYFKIDITNNTGLPKWGSWVGGRAGTTTAAHSYGKFMQGTFVYDGAATITQVDIGFNAPDAYFGTSTVITVTAW